MFVLRSRKFGAFGVIMYYMQTKEMPFADSSKPVERSAIRNGITEDRVEKCSPKTQDLIRIMMAQKREDRPNAEDLLLKDWFRTSNAKAESL